MKCCTPRHSFPFTESLGFICPTQHGAEKRDAVSVLFLWCLMMACDFGLWVILERFLSWKQLNLGNACWTFVVLSSWIQRRGVDMHQFHRPLNLRHLRDSIGGSICVWHAPMAECPRCLYCGFLVRCYPPWGAHSAQATGELQSHECAACSGFAEAKERRYGERLKYGEVQVESR